MMKHRCKCILLICFMLSILTVDASALFAETGNHAPGKMILRIAEGTAPYTIYKSLDLKSWDQVAVTEKDRYEEYGLENGVTYYYQVKDANGEICNTSYTTPFLNVEDNSLSVEQLKDTWVHLRWSKTYSNITLYCNGEEVSAVRGNEYTVTNLSPNTSYSFYYLTRTGYKSNVVKLTTPNDMSTFLGRLNKLLEDLFMDDKFRIDSNGDGISDGFQPIKDKANGILENPLIDLPNRVGDIGKDAANRIPSGNPSDLHLYADLGALGKIDMLGGLAAFIAEIKLLRRLLVAVLYGMVIYYFIRKLVPSLRA